MTRNDYEHMPVAGGLGFWVSWRSPSRADHVRKLTDGAGIPHEVYEMCAAYRYEAIQAAKTADLLADTEYAETSAVEYERALAAYETALDNCCEALQM